MFVLSGGKCSFRSTLLAAGEQIRIKIKSDYRGAVLLLSGTNTTLKKTFFCSVTAHHSIIGRTRKHSVDHIQHITELMTHHRTHCRTQHMTMTREYMTNIVRCNIPTQQLYLERRSLTAGGSMPSV